MQRSEIAGNLASMNKCLDSAALHRGYDRHDIRG